ncbi:glyoxylase I 4 isoform X1 [Elaeis guineensis]|uniref:Uncharacterized protein LOC105049128 isoform X1 n=1 Tax=Elaeis guineensis var. tenera TaxID=51953 RepID=A0A6I9RIC9_ELAGV|nr:uncharacterized protein LOC105049128 isoform X1 [Elaeis guineensis]
MDQLKEEEQQQQQQEQNFLEEETKQLKEYDTIPPTPLIALNHVSRLCKSVQASIDFYVKVLGFVLIHRPPTFDFDGAWSQLTSLQPNFLSIPLFNRTTFSSFWGCRLFNYGVGIHLIQKKDGGSLMDARPDKLDPLDNHVSFQCEDMEVMEKRLKETNIKYLKRTVGGEEEEEEEASPIDQLFFNDPDGFMIEICNCENLELVPAGSLGRIRLPRHHHNPPLHINGSQNQTQRQDQA